MDFWKENRLVFMTVDAADEGPAGVEAEPGGDEELSPEEKIDKRKGEIRDTVEGSTTILENLKDIYIDAEQDIDTDTSNDAAFQAFYEPLSQKLDGLVAEFDTRLDKEAADLEMAMRKLDHQLFNEVLDIAGLSSHPTESHAVIEGAAQALGTDTDTVEGDLRQLSDKRAEDIDALDYAEDSVDGARTSLRGFKILYPDINPTRLETIIDQFTSLDEYNAEDVKDPEGLKTSTDAVFSNFYQTAYTLLPPETRGDYANAEDFIAKLNAAAAEAESIDDPLEKYDQEIDGFRQRIREIREAMGDDMTDDVQHILDMAGIDIDSLERKRNHPGEGGFDPASEQATINKVEERLSSIIIPEETVDEFSEIRTELQDKVTDYRDRIASGDLEVSDPKIADLVLDLWESQISETTNPSAFPGFSMALQEDAFITEVDSIVNDPDAPEKLLYYLNSLGVVPYATVEDVPDDVDLYALLEEREGSHLDAAALPAEDLDSLASSVSGNERRAAEGLIRNHESVQSFNGGTAMGAEKMKTLHIVGGAPNYQIKMSLTTRLEGGQAFLVMDYTGATFDQSFADAEEFKKVYSNVALPEPGGDMTIKDRERVMSRSRPAPFGGAIRKRDLQISVSEDGRISVTVSNIRFNNNPQIEVPLGKKMDELQHSADILFPPGYGPRSKKPETTSGSSGEAPREGAFSINMEAARTDFAEYKAKYDELTGEMDNLDAINDSLAEMPEFLQKKFPLVQARNAMATLEEEFAKDDPDDRAVADALEQLEGALEGLKNPMEGVFSEYQDFLKKGLKFKEEDGNPMTRLQATFPRAAMRLAGVSIDMKKIVIKPVRPYKKNSVRFVFKGETDGAPVVLEGFSGKSESWDEAVDTAVTKFLRWRGRRMDRLYTRPDYTGAKIDDVITSIDADGGKAADYEISQDGERWTAYKIDKEVNPEQRAANMRARFEAVSNKDMPPSALSENEFQEYIDAQWDKHLGQAIGAAGIGNLNYEDVPKKGSAASRDLILRTPDGSKEAKIKIRQSYSARPVSFKPGEGMRVTYKTNRSIPSLAEALKLAAADLRGAEVIPTDEATGEMVPGAYVTSVEDSEVGEVDSTETGGELPDDLDGLRTALDQVITEVGLAETARDELAAQIQQFQADHPGEDWTTEFDDPLAYALRVSEAQQRLDTIRGKIDEIERAEELAASREGVAAKMLELGSDPDARGPINVEGVEFTVSNPETWDSLDSGDIDLGSDLILWKEGEYKGVAFSVGVYSNNPDHVVTISRDNREVSTISEGDVGANLAEWVREQKARIDGDVEDVDEGLSEHGMPLEFADIYTTLHLRPESTVRFQTLEISGEDTFTLAIDDNAIDKMASWGITRDVASLTELIGLDNNVARVAIIDEHDLLAIGIENKDGSIREGIIRRGADGVEFEEVSDEEDVDEDLDGSVLESTTPEEFRELLFQTGIIPETSIGFFSVERPDSTSILVASDKKADVILRTEGVNVDIDGISFHGQPTLNFSEDLTKVAIVAEDEYLAVAIEHKDGSVEKAYLEVIDGNIQLVDTLSDIDPSTEANQAEIAHRKDAINNKLLELGAMGDNELTVAGVTFRPMDGNGSLATDADWIRGWPKYSMVAEYEGETLSLTLGFNSDLLVYVKNGLGGHLSNAAGLEEYVEHHKERIDASREDMDEGVDALPDDLEGLRTALDQAIMEVGLAENARDEHLAKIEQFEAENPDGDWTTEFENPLVFAQRVLEAQQRVDTIQGKIDELEQAAEAAPRKEGVEARLRELGAENLGDNVTIGGVEFHSANGDGNLDTDDDWLNDNYEYWMISPDGSLRFGITVDAPHNLVVRDYIAGEEMDAEIPDIPALEEQLRQQSELVESERQYQEKIQEGIDAGYFEVVEVANKDDGIDRGFLYRGDDGASYVEDNFKWASNKHKNLSIVRLKPGFEWATDDDFDLAVEPIEESVLIERRQESLRKGLESGHFQIIEFSSGDDGVERGYLEKDATDGSYGLRYNSLKRVSTEDDNFNVIRLHSNFKWVNDDPFDLTYEMIESPVSVEQRKTAVLERVQGLSGVDSLIDTFEINGVAFAPLDGDGGINEQQWDFGKGTYWFKNEDQGLWIGIDISSKSSYKFKVSGPDKKASVLGTESTAVTEWVEAQTDVEQRKAAVLERVQELDGDAATLTSTLEVGGLRFEPLEGNGGVVDGQWETGSGVHWLINDEQNLSIGVHVNAPHYFEVAAGLEVHTLDNSTAVTEWVDAQTDDDDDDGSIDAGGTIEDIAELDTGLVDPSDAEKKTA